MKRWINAGLRPAGFELRKTVRSLADEKERNPDITVEEWNIYSEVRDFTMLSLERILANIRATRYVCDRRIPGAIVECGVWRGGSSMAMALACSDKSRAFWMYDTYEGMTAATDADLDSKGAKAAALMQDARRSEVREQSLVLAYASLEDVKANMARTQYPGVRFVAGPVEQTIPGQMPEQIALLRIDTDWYESTKHELKYLYPRLSVGGILIIDDYGHWQGARKAVDEYFKDSGPFLNRIDYTGRLMVKQ